MVQWVITDRVDLSKDAQRQQVGAPEALMLPGDNEAHRWEITVLNNGEAADLAGASVAGYFLRADGETVAVVGSVTGNVISVVLAQECYAFEGLMRAIVRVTLNGVITTVIQRLFRVQQDIGDQIIDPGEVIPGIDELLAQIAAMEAATAECEEVTEAAHAVTDTVGYTIFSGLDERQGNIAGTGNWSSINNKYLHRLIKVKPTDTLSITANSLKTAYYALLTSDSAPVNGQPAPLCEGTSAGTVNVGTTKAITIPEDAQFLLVMSLRNNEQVTPAAITLNGVNTCISIAENFKSDTAQIVTNTTDIAALDARVTALETPGVNWCALGDSITEGVYSVKEWTEDDGGKWIGVAHTNKVDTWAYRLARAKGWTLTNLGVGGTGFIDPVNNPEPPDNKEYKGYQVARETDFSSYNLITVAYGVNDYNAVTWNLGHLDTETDWTTATPGDIFGAIQATIEGIMLTAGAAKIIFLTPLNERGYKSNGQDSRGTYADNYALGFEVNHRTLKDVRDAIITCCEYYGIEYIDMSYTSVINRLTLKADVDSLAPDGVHPSLAAHAELAREIGAKISFGA